MNDVAKDGQVWLFVFVNASDQSSTLESTQTVDEITPVKSFPGLNLAY